MSIKTLTRKKFVYDEQSWTITAEYGVTEREDTASCFAVTGTARPTGKRNDAEDVDGAIHDMIEAAFPHLGPIIKLHLNDAETGEPLHAVANSWYWYTSVAADGTPRGPLFYPAKYNGLSNIQRAASYLGCDVSALKTINDLRFVSSTAQPPQAFIDAVDALRPGWKLQAAAIRQQYDI